MLKYFHFAIALTVLFPLHLFGQRGQPFVTDIPFERGLGELRVSGLMQTSDRNILMCTSRGILAFDGAVWELIPTPSPPITMTESADGSVFVGMRRGAAKLAISDSGYFRLHPLLPSLLQESVQQIMITDELLYLLSDSRLLTLSLANLDTLTTLNFGDRIYSGAFLQFNILHLIFYKEGLFSYQNETLTPIGNFRKVTENQLVFNINTPRGTFLCLDNGDLLLFDGIRMQTVGGTLGGFLSNSVPSDGVILNDTLIAISTLSGGVVVADIHSLEVLHRLNLTTGLPDNEVTAVGRDDNGGLWMSYASGISRLDMMHPISRYHNYPGLKGMITSIATKDDDLFVGTGNGVFVLRRSLDMVEVQRAMAERAETMNLPKSVSLIEASRSNQQVTVLTREQEANTKAVWAEKYEADPSAVKKELSRKEFRELRKYIKDNKKLTKAQDDELKVASDAESVPEAEEQEAPSSETIAASPKAISSEKKASTAGNPLSEPADGAFLFRAVKGLEVKCKQLTEVNNMLFAATGNGVYLIENESAVNLTPGLYVNHISASHDGQSLLLATTNGAFILKRDASKWELRAVHDAHRSNVYHVIEDQSGNIWAGADNAVQRFLSTKEGYEPREFTLESGQLERVLVAELAGVVHLLVPSGILRMEETGPVKASVDGLGHQTRLDFFLGDNGLVWIHANGEWTALNSEGQQHLLTYLPIFDDIRHLAIDKRGRLLVVDEGREIYSIDPRQISDSKQAFSVFIRKALAEDRTPFSMESLTVKAGENSIVFQLSAPFYLKGVATEYQYRVEGLRNSWSRWVNSPTIEIPFLPAGDYVLHVRARNVLGEESEVRSLAFTVLKPIWQRWYALLCYALALLGAVWLIIKARERNLRETQRELEEKVQERTAELASEKERTEKLLLNILPKETAEELRKSGKATARHYNQVSVLFTDFKGFTRFAESTKPEDLVQELDRCFIAFDDIIDKYHLEKIKTIGDAYMCAGGVPIRNTNNAVAIVMAAIEIRDFMLNLQKEKQERNERFWEIRLGVSTGPLTAGVVGKKKFAYDIWGDTVNTASRMESMSDSGMVNISASTYELVKDYFDCTYRGKKDAKGKGEVDMYFVNGIREDFSENGDGITPNAKLRSAVS